MKSSDSELDNPDDSSEVLKPKKKVKFQIENEDDDMQHKSKKRKILASTDVDNTKNITSENKKKIKKPKALENQREEHTVLDDDVHEHPDESHSNDSIDWPQNDLRTLVKNIEQTLPEKDNLAFQTRADKLNWDDIAFDKYTGDDCKRTWFLIQKRIRRFRLLSELLQDAKDWISKPWTHFYKGNKNNRHPDMPKRPLSGYMLFYLKKKDKVLAQNPGLEMTEVSKRMAQLYKSISVEKREKYMQLAVAEKKAYEEKLEEFYRLHPDIPRCPEKSIHSKAIETGPKKPSTPFSCFYNTQLRDFHPEFEVEGISFKEQCKEQWKNMSDKKKIVWIDIALGEEDKYQEELKNYMVQNPHYVSTPYKSVVTKEERAIKERLAGKPIKPPNSAYGLFSQIMLKSEEIKKIDPKGRMKALADQWKLCSEEEKKVYQEHTDQLMSKYKLDFATYLESLPESKRQEELQKTLPKRKGTKVEDLKSKSEEDKHKNDLEKGKNEEKKPKTDKKNIVETQPPHPPQSGLALFSKRYHGKAPVKTAWKNLNKLEKQEYEAEVKMLKQKYIKHYEAFLKSLSKEQLTAFSEMHKGKNKSHKQEQHIKQEQSSSEDEDDDDDDEDYNTDHS
ncbi:hypothetical protein FQR65_LT12287 [Abscondita terminalis]|nr:hypothetical protein FQR65_LT12287 [Abscondita terminalis]